MEKTVSVKTESDTVKVAVITSQNKIITDPIEKEKPNDKTNVQLRQSVRASSKRFNAHLEH